MPLSADSKMPRQLWGLWGTNDDDSTFWVRAIDCAGDPILCYQTLADALDGAKHHVATYDIMCEPVQLITPEDHQ